MAADFVARRWAKNAAAVTVIGLVVLLSDPSGHWRGSAAYAQTPLPTLQAGYAAVVPPGQEDLLAQMLGLGAALPAECRFTDGDANGPIIRGDYVCGANQATFELHYPSDAPASAPRTAKFALVVHSGTPPPELTDALLSLIRSKEGPFEWKVMELPRPAPIAALGEQVSSDRVVIVIVILFGIVAVLAVGWMLRRSQSRRPPG